MHHDELGDEASVAAGPVERAELVVGRVGVVGDRHRRAARDVSTSQTPSYRETL